jgi:hypothetical protein
MAPACRPVPDDDRFAAGVDSYAGWSKLGTIGSLALI